jgi:hypothetical protein
MAGIIVIMGRIPIFFIIVPIIMTIPVLINPCQGIYNPWTATLGLVTGCVEDWRR